MNNDKGREWIIKLIIGMALPTVSCFGFYTIGYIKNPGSLTIFLIVLAYPAVLLASIGLARCIRSRPISKTKGLFWLVLATAPALFLTYLWFWQAL